MVYRSANDWENTLITWSQPLGKVEDEKAERAVTAIERAVRNSSRLQGRSVTTFVQGSYRNNTGVRQESDVDVCVLSTQTFHYNDIPSPYTPVSLGITPASYTYPSFRDDLEAALVAEFGRAAVKNGNKAFNVRENTYRVEADAVPCFEYREYTNSYGVVRYESGTCLFARDGTFITNFPQQQHNNGLKKDLDTGYRFKPVVRAIKKLSCEMVDEGSDAAKPMKSFLLESLIWNVADSSFLVPGMRDRVGGMLDEIGAMMRYNKGSSFKEENGIKPLFGPLITWTPDQVERFAQAARKHIGFN